eukprot:1007956-Amphidinium_carterae.2
MLRWSCVAKHTAYGTLQSIAILGNPQVLGFVDDVYANQLSDRNNLRGFSGLHVWSIVRCCRIYPCGAWATPERKSSRVVPSQPYLPPSLPAQICHLKSFCSFTS